MLKCDKRAFSRCEYMEKCGPDAEYTEGSECDKFNKAVLERPMTNADRIRDMSDEDLASVLVKYEGTEKRPTRFGGHEHIFRGPNGETCGTKAYALQLWMEWLRQPAEEE